MKRLIFDDLLIIFVVFSRSLGLQHEVHIDIKRIKRGERKDNISERERESLRELGERERGRQGETGRGL